MATYTENSDKYNQIADLFIESLLKITHVSPCIKLNNSFHELLLFTYPQANILSSSRNNIFYMKNNRKHLKQVLTEESVFYCDIYVNIGRKVETVEFKCDNKWYKFLKEVLKAPRNDDGKYYCNIQCPELFEIIVGKLEELDYDFNKYVEMEQEFKKLGETIDSLPQKRKNIETEIKNLTDAIQRTDSVICEDYDKKLDRINDLSLQLIEVKDIGLRYLELKSTIVSGNIKKVRNVKAFLSAVKKTEAYTQIVESKVIHATAPCFPCTNQSQYVVANNINIYNNNLNEELTATDRTIIVEPNNNDTSNTNPVIISSCPVAHF